MNHWADWAVPIWDLAIAAQGLMFLTHPIKAAFWAPRIPILLDLGKRPWTARRIGGALFMTAGLLEMGWMYAEMSPWTKSLACVVFLVGLSVFSAYESLQPLCLREDGMRVLTKFLWSQRPAFLPWSEIQQFQWSNATTLIVNSGWHQVTCLIPEEHVDRVKSILRVRVPLNAAE